MSSKSKTSGGGAAAAAAAERTSGALDVCFVCDTTGSMGGAIRTVQSRLKEVAEQICAGETHDLRLAAVEYKDHCDPVVVDSADFTPSVSKLKTAIDKWRASGGGDAPEALADGLHAASKLAWRDDATKIVVLCADAPPHGIGASHGDNHPNGCPLDLDPIAIATQLAAKGVIIYTVGVNAPCAKTVAFLCTLSSMTGGRYVPLADAASLPTILVGGAAEEAALEKFAADMQSEREAVLEQATAAGKVLNDDDVFAAVATNMQARGISVAQPQVDQAGGGDTWQAAVDGWASKCTSLGAYAAAVNSDASALAAAPRVERAAPAYAAAAAAAATPYGAPPAPVGMDAYGSMPCAMPCAAAPSLFGACDDGAPAAAPTQNVGYGAMPISAEQVKRSMVRHAKRGAA